MSEYFWQLPITGDRAEHAARGTGPATDYAAPMRTPVHAPFAGRMERFSNTEGGLGLRLIGERYICVVQHLDERTPAGDKGWRDVIAYSGNTGSATTGPHVHAYIIVRATGARISFTEWLRDYANKPQPQPAAAPQLTAGKRRVRFPKSGVFWYHSAGAAAGMSNPQGGKYGGGSMLEGLYTIQEQQPGAFRVLSNANGRVWVHESMLKYLV